MATMETLRSDDPQAPVRAAQILASRGIVLYPTDTLYGLGADALSDEAVAKVYAIKGREEGKPMHCVVADMTMAAEFGEVTGLAERLAERFLPGPLTLILKKKEELDTGSVRGLSTIGVRIPHNEFCIRLAKVFRKPFTATSANKSGQKPERSIEKIIAQLGDAAQLIDLVIDAGELPDSLPSTVVDVSSGEAFIVREGAIPAADIRVTTAPE